MQDQDPHPPKKSFTAFATRWGHNQNGNLRNLAASAIAVGAVVWSVFATVLVGLTYFGADEIDTDLGALQAAYDQRVETLLSRQDQDQTRIAELEKQLETASSRVMSLQVALMQQSSTAISLERAAAAVKLELRNRAHEIAALEEAQSALTTELATLEQARTQDANHAAALTETIGILGARLQETGTELRVKTEALAALNADHEKIQTELALNDQFEERLYTRLEEAVEFSMLDLESMLKRAGTDVEAILQAMRRNYSGQGGPIMPVLEDETFVPEATHSRLNHLLSDMDRMHLLKLAADYMPLRHPVRSAHRTTSGFGPRKDPFTGAPKMHNGIDFAARRGTPIYSTGAGEVIFAGTMNGYGKIVKIRHDFGFETRYAHLHRIRVNKGDIVTGSTRVGDMGNTGRSTGTHLHYEIRIDGKPINPMTQIRAAQNVL